MQERERAESLQLCHEELSNKSSGPGLQAADNRGQHQPVDMSEAEESVREKAIRHKREEYQK